MAAGDPINNILKVSKGDAELGLALSSVSNLAERWGSSFPEKVDNVEVLAQINTSRIYFSSAASFLKSKGIAIATNYGIGFLILWVRS